MFPVTQDMMTTEIDELDEIAEQMDKKRNPGSGRTRLRKRPAHRNGKVSEEMRLTNVIAAATRWSNSRNVPITLPRIKALENVQEEE